MAKYMLLYYRSDQFIQLSSNEASSIIPMVVRSQESTEVDRDIVMTGYGDGWLLGPIYYTMGKVGSPWGSEAGEQAEEKKGTRKFGQRGAFGKTR